jgi:nucleotide-binding universal stress UspA family protein
VTIELAGVPPSDGPDLRERISIPVDRDRAPEATTRVATTLARQGDLGLEFVIAAGLRRPDRLDAQLRERCAAATAAGAPRATWRVVDPASGGVDAYVTWSGSCLQCIGHAHAPLLTWERPGGVPLLIVGPACRPNPTGYRHFVVGLDGASGRGSHVAGVAAGLARRLGAELVFIEVFAPRSPRGDVPECAHLHHVVGHLDADRRMFDTVHDRRPADGIVRFVGADDQAIIVVGTGGRHRRRRGVPGALIRRARCPVLVVPPGATPLR